MRFAPLVALFLVAAPPQAAAQGVTLDSLAARAQRLRAAAMTAEAADIEVKGRREQEPRDTVRFDPLTVLVLRGDGPRAAQGVEMAATHMRDLLGTGAELLRNRPIELRFGMGTTSAAGAVPVIGIPDSASAQTVADALMRWAGPMITAHGSPELRAWAVVPINVNDTRLRQAAHVDLVTAIPGVTARCVAGGISDCAIAMGLMLPDDPATVYWDSAGRWEMVRRGARGYFVGDIRPLSRDCVASFLDAACIAFLRRVNPSADSPRAAALALAPLGTAPRQALLRTALAMGRDGALGRLVGDSTRGTVASIEAAAGLPLDSVLRVWRQDVLQVQVDGGSRTTAGAFALFWALVFAGMALGGTRWRAG